MSANVRLLTPHSSLGGHGAGNDALVRFPADLFAKESRARTPMARARRRRPDARPAGYAGGVAVARQAQPALRAAHGLRRLRGDRERREDPRQRPQGWPKNVLPALRLPGRAEGRDARAADETQARAGDRAGHPGYAA